MMCASILQRSELCTVSPVNAIESVEMSQYWGSRYLELALIVPIASEIQIVRLRSLYLSAYNHQLHLSQIAKSTLYLSIIVYFLVPLLVPEQLFDSTSDNCQT